MRLLSGPEADEAWSFFLDAARVAAGSPCHRKQGGSVIVRDGEIIGSGYNGPPAGVHLERCLKDDLSEEFRSDRTCCVHAEQRAIFDALVRNAARVPGSRLYYLRLDAGSPVQSGEPYCTICSKSALEVGVAEFALWRREGICVYDTYEYNERSFGR